MTLLTPRKIDGWVQEGLLLYADEKALRAWFQLRRLQLPREGTKPRNPKLITRDDLVKEKILVGFSPSDPGIFYSIGSADYLTNLSTALDAMRKSPKERLEFAKMRRRN